MLITPTSIVPVAPYRPYTEAVLRVHTRQRARMTQGIPRYDFQSFRKFVSHTEDFESMIVFVRDVTRCLERLTPAQQHILQRIAIEGYTQGEYAAMAGLRLRTAIRGYVEALDALTAMFIIYDVVKYVQE